MATEDPSPDLLLETPHGRTEPLINKAMWLHIFVQGIYQIFWLMLIFYGAPAQLKVAIQSSHPRTHPPPSPPPLPCSPLLSAHCCPLPPSLSTLLPHRLPLWLALSPLCLLPHPSMTRVLPISTVFTTQVAILTRAHSAKLQPSYLIRALQFAQWL